MATASFRSSPSGSFSISFKRFWSCMVKGSLGSKFGCVARPSMPPVSTSIITATAPFFIMNFSMPS